MSATAKPLPTVRSFASDERGVVMMVFALSFMAIALAAGMGIDFARIVHIKSRLTQAADAASLAAGRALIDGRLSDPDVEAIALQVFEANMDDAGQVLETVATPDISVTRATGEVRIAVEAVVPMTLTKLAGFNEARVPVLSAARFDQHDIELSLALDLTGSMGWGTKLDDLKSATDDLIEILLPDEGTPNKVRIALAPYSSGVNAGSYAFAATGQTTHTCTFEREGSNPLGDQAPGPGDYLKTRGDEGVVSYASCPSSAPVVPLSDDKTTLKTTVAGYTTGGSTAGHLGTQWATYLLSPEWAGVFGGDAPADYDDGSTVKAMVLMTDGLFNTVGGKNYGDGSLEGRDSREWTVEMCEAMRAQNVLVFTVGFALDDISSPSFRDEVADTLRDCAGDTTRFFDAKNGQALRTAFQSIAQQLNNLRLTN